MATRSGVPGTKSGGTDSLSVADFNNLPGGCIAYVTKTGNQTSISSVTDISGLSITYTFPGSRRYRISGHLPQIQTSGTYPNNQFIIRLRDGGSGTIADMWDQSNQDAEWTSVNFVYMYAPSSGSATLKLTAVPIGSTALDINCSSPPSTPGPAHFMIEDMGPDF